MSDLGGLRTVPALLALACILLAVAVVTGLCAAAIEQLQGHIRFRIAVTAAILSLIAAVAVAITAAGLRQKHWDDSCHRAGGVLDSGGDHECVKPHSFINVP